MPAAIAPIRSFHDHWRHHIVAESGVMRRLLRDVERVAAKRVPVLVLGETGAGKEIVSRAIHAAGPPRPLVAVNCAALPASLADTELFGHLRGAFTGADRTRHGLLEQADGGTLVLDEIAELDLAIQAKLLRVVEDGEIRPVGSVIGRRVDVRLVSATNRDLAADVRAGRFRADLYHRLAGVTFHVPPLRSRPEDIAPLVEVFLAQEADGLRRVSEEALAHLRTRSWPGNVRELRQAVRHAVIFGGAVLVPADFPDESIPRAAEAPPDGWLSGQRWDAIERQVLAWALARHGSIRAAAAALGVPRSTLLDRLRARGLAVRPERRAE